MLLEKQASIHSYRSAPVVLQVLSTLRRSTLRYQVLITAAVRIFEIIAVAYEPQVRTSMHYIEVKVAEFLVALRDGLMVGFRVAGFVNASTLKLVQIIPHAKNHAFRLLLRPGASVSEDFCDGEELVVFSGEETMPLSIKNTSEENEEVFQVMAASHENIIGTIVNEYLEPYQQLFQPPPSATKKRQRTFPTLKTRVDAEKPPYSLTEVERRFAWYRNVLQETEDKFQGVFPTHWNFHYRMTVLFLKKTNSHLLQLLDADFTKDEDCNNATILLKALQATILFEKELMALLQRNFQTVFLDSSRHIDGGSIQLNSGDGGSNASMPVDSLVGIASSAFGNYMEPYIELEKESLLKLIAQSMEDDSIERRNEMPVFSSSVAVFKYMQGSVVRCTAIAKSRALYLLLHRAFQDSLLSYAQQLTDKLSQSSAPIGWRRRRMKINCTTEQSPDSESMPLSDGEQLASQIISTCEYCIDTIDDLEEMIRGTIDEEFKNRIDMSFAQDSFHDLAAKSLDILVRDFMDRCQPYLKQMARINWGKFKAVGDESSYVHGIIASTVPFFGRIRHAIPPSYYKNLCDRIVTQFSEAYHKSLLRLHRISEQGSQQLLLDTNNFKTVMLKLPTIDNENNRRIINSASPTSFLYGYAKMVKSQFNKIERTLKLVNTPAESLVDVFRAQQTTDLEVAVDIQTIMSLQGMRRKDQTAIMEQYRSQPI